jgi:hypothetical protein
MYKAKAHHPLSTPLPEVAAEVEKAMWGLFVAIGDAWRLPDQDVVETYHLRFDAFLENRIAIDPLNGKYYEAAAELIADLAAQLDLAAAYELIFFGDNPDDLEYIPALLSAIEQHVVNELINFRLACGSFKAWGAVNFRTYFGGANLAGEPVPYRIAKGLK